MGEAKKIGCGARPEPNINTHNKHAHANERQYFYKIVKGVAMHTAHHVVYMKNNIIDWMLSI